MAQDIKERYINPYTDFGFKKLFGTEMNKDLLISFLNALFMGHQNIKDISYLPMERLGIYGNRRAIFDVYCEDENGSKFIVEMQNVSQQYYKDRSAFYSTFPIQDQGNVGDDWDFNLKEVYTVGVLNFVFKDDEYSKDCYHHEVKLMDTATKKVFFDKLTYIYLEMPKFNKTEDELETMFDKWMFVLQNLYRLLERPKALQDRVFKKLFEQAEIAKYSEAERWEYEASQKEYWDNYSVVKTAERKGEVKGAQKEKIETIHRLQAMGLSVEQIAQGVGMEVKEVKKLLQ